ncbi:hypothetical protein F5Y09DRAFT_162945 [Xylaria sp. FL1042]|nr:hypothetical protein F5Y09DRAFT_162945 [Xylaria sp. FL1042]
MCAAFQQTFHWHTSSKVDGAVVIVGRTNPCVRQGHRHSRVFRSGLGVWFVLSPWILFGGWQFEPTTAVLFFCFFLNLFQLPGFFYQLI